MHIGIIILYVHYNSSTPLFQFTLIKFTFNQINWVHCFSDSFFTEQCMQVYLSQQLNKTQLHCEHIFSGGENTTQRQTYSLTLPPKLFPFYTKTTGCVHITEEFLHLLLYAVIHSHIQTYHYVVSLLYYLISTMSSIHIICMKCIYLSVLLS